MENKLSPFIVFDLCDCRKSIKRIDMEGYYVDR